MNKIINSILKFIDKWYKAIIAFLAGIIAMLITKILKDDKKNKKREENIEKLKIAVRKQGAMINELYEGDNDGQNR